MNLLDIFDRLREYLQNILRKKWILLGFTVIFAAVFLLQALSKPPYFTAKAVFHPAQEKTSGSLETGLTQFFGLPGEEGSELTYMKGLLDSRSLTRSLVGDTILFNGEKHLMADLVLSNNPDYTSLVSRIRSMFLGSEDPTDLPFSEKLIISGTIARRSMIIETNENGFAEIKVSFYDKDITALLCEQYLVYLRKYYAEQTVRNGQQTLQFLTKRADSIKKELDQINYRLAEAREQGRFSIRYRDEIGPAEMESQQALLSQMYISLYVNQEQTRAQLQRDLSPIQVVDPPMPPFPVTRPSLIIYLLLGSLIGMGIAAVLVSYPLLKEDVTLAIQTLVIQPAMNQRASQDSVDEPVDQA